MKFKFYLTLLILLGITENIYSAPFWWINYQRKTTFSTTVSTTTTVPSIPASTLPILPDIVCCECVQFYFCLNGTISSDGSYIIDLRFGLDSTFQAGKPPTINVDICPTDNGDLLICCAPPDVDPSCLQTKPTPTTVAPINVPHPDSYCECVVYNDCNPNLVVSNGLGNTSMELSNGRIVSHDKCHHSLEVCCYSPELILDDKVTESPKIVDETCPECVPRYLCDSEGYIIEDGSNLVDLRIGGRLVKQCPNNSSLICCHLRNYAEPTEHVVTLPSTPELTSEANLKPKLCGVRNFNGIRTRILGFRESQTQFGEFPWVATLLKRKLIGKNFYPLFLGGASLIHRKVVLTAAHKLNGIAAEDLKIRLGEWDTVSEKEPLPYQDMLVEEIIIHPLYNPGPLHYDVALLILKNESKLDDHIGTICVSSNVNEVDSSSCVVNGWGVDEFASGNYQKLLKSVSLPLVDKQICQSLLRKTRLSKYFRLHHSFICAGGEEGVDACKGDGGGPLACRSKADPSRYYQVGISAWGIGCGMENVPGVYVDVTEHFDWINSCIQNRIPDFNISRNTNL